MLALTGSFVLAADIDVAAVAERVPAGEFSVPLSPAFLSWVGEQIGSQPGTHDALLVQAAHPEVAAGVSDHSRYREDPLGRLTRTASFVTAINGNSVTTQRVRESNPRYDCERVAA